MSEAAYETAPSKVEEEDAAAATYPNENAPGFRRKKVNMPNSLPELQQAALLHLYPKKPPVRLRLFHGGREGPEIRHHGHVNKFVDGDIVHAKRGFLAKAEDPPTTSTQKADYVTPGFIDQPKPTMSDDDSVLTAVSFGKPLDGASMYHTDYVRHPVTRRNPNDLETQRSHIRTGEPGPMEKSSYSHQFTWHDVTPPGKNFPTAESVISQNSLGRFFDAQSGYKMDYHRDKNWKTPQPERVQVNDNTSSLTDAVVKNKFNGQSTYAGHYTPFPGAEKRQSCRPEYGTKKTVGIQGNSEYRRQYLGGIHSQRMAAIHLQADDCD